MKTLSIVLFAFLLTACGAETSGTALTAATIKKQELEEGKKTMEQAQKKIEQSVDLIQQRTMDAENAAAKQ
jgi:hypothetical protein